MTSLCGAGAQVGSELVVLTCHQALTVSFFSAADADSERETKKRNAKVAFEINFEEDIDFDAHFRKTKVCAGSPPLPALSFAGSVRLGTVAGNWVCKPSFLVQSLLTPGRVKSKEFLPTLGWKIRLDSSWLLPWQPKRRCGSRDAAQKPLAALTGPLWVSSLETAQNLPLSDKNPCSNHLFAH